jgi:hypothetical protein
VVQRLKGRGLSGAGEALGLARQIVQRLQSVLHQDGAACRLRTCLDGLLTSPGQWPLLRSGEDIVIPEPPQAGHVAGLTAWDPLATAKGQMRAAGSLHAAVGGGAACLLIQRESLPSPDQIADWLTWAWRRTDLVRLRFLVDR